jgi:hypothetical protein
MFTPDSLARWPFHKSLGTPGRRICSLSPADGGPDSDRRTSVRDHRRLSGLVPTPPRGRHASLAQNPLRLLLEASQEQGPRSTLGGAHSSATPWPVGAHWPKSAMPRAIPTSLSRASTCPRQVGVQPVTGRRHPGSQEWLRRCVPNPVRVPRGARLLALADIHAVTSDNRRQPHFPTDERSDCGARCH